MPKMTIPTIESGVSGLAADALWSYYADLARQEEAERSRIEAQRREETEALSRLIEEWIGVTVREDILSGRDVILGGLHFRMVLARRGFASYELALVVPCARCGYELVCDLTEGVVVTGPLRHIALKRIGQILAEPTQHITCPDPDEGEL